MSEEIREFVRDVGGPIVIAELFALAAFLSMLLFVAGMLVGDI